MSIELYLAFVLAASVLVLIPGPNVTLHVADSLTYGARTAFATIARATLAPIVPWLRGAGVERTRNKVTGALLIASGVGLALARRR